MISTMEGRWTCVVVLLTALASVRAQQNLCETQYGSEEFMYTMENIAPGTDIGHINIKGDNSEIALQQYNNDYYRFNNVTRNVTLKKELDTDVGSTEPPILVIECRKKVVGSDARPIQINVKIIITDYNDNAPKFEREHYNVSISEDALVETIVYSDAVATDMDKQNEENSRISYRIIPGQNFSNYFRMEVPTTPVIRLARTLDYETTTTMILEIEASDKPSEGRGRRLSSTATITIHIIDADDQNPRFSLKKYDGKIRQDAPTGTAVEVIHKIVAVDPDSMNVSVVYRLLDPYEIFEINNTTAVVYNTKPLYVDVPTVTVVVLASQVDNRNREWFAMLTISITEANINAPRFSQDVYEIVKSEAELVGAILVITPATDIDFGTLIQYAIVEDVSDQFSINEKGAIKLLRPLDYEQERTLRIHVTASDGSHTAKAAVHISVVDVNDNNPVLHTEGTQFWLDRVQNAVVTKVNATDADTDNVLRFELKTYKEEFSISADGEIKIIATPEKLVRDEYFLHVVVYDNGITPREASTQINVIFPPTGYVPTTSTESAVVTPVPVPEDNMLTIILGAGAGVLLVVILILVVYIVWRNKRTKEELDRARAPKGYAAQGLTYRQADVPDDLPKMDLHYSDDTDGNSVYDGSTTIQQNPLRNAGVNKGYLQNSGSQMDRDLNEIEVETAVIPYDDDDYGYQSNHSDYNGLQTFQSDDTTSSGSNVSTSTGGSRRGLVNENDKKSGSKMTSWDSDDKIHPQGSKKLLDSNIIIPSTKVKKEKPEITVYF